MTDKILHDMKQIAGLMKILMSEIDRLFEDVGVKTKEAQDGDVNRD